MGLLLWVHVCSYFSELWAVRKIIHIDMDAFYASVEQRDNPHLRGRPIAVGGSPNGRGVVATASYEARRYGVRSAMPSARAITLCPDIIFVRPRFDAYKEASNAIRDIFEEYTDLIEPLSLDEAYLDVTENKKGIPFALRVAQRIREDIVRELGITATAGVSYCKFLAKMASGYKKPNGLNFIPPENALIFIDQLPIDQFHGIGEKTAEKMRSMGIFNGADLRGTDLRTLVKRFGKMGRFYHKIASGEDNRPIITHRPRKSASVEDTFPEDLSLLPDMDLHIERMASTLMGRIEPKGLFGRSVHLKVKFADFTSITRSQSFSDPVKDAGAIAETCKDLLRKTEAGERKVRLLGVGVSNFDGAPNEGEDGQLELDL